jgi:uncharacterized membrane protein
MIGLVLVTLAAFILALSATGAVALLIVIFPSIPAGVIPVVFVASSVILFVLVFFLYWMGKTVEREDSRAKMQRRVLQEAIDDRFTTLSIEEDETVSIPPD